MKVAVVINGPPRCGKDTFVEMVRETATVPVHNVSSVTPAKKAAEILGWDGEKDERGRKFLSDLKDLSTRTYGGPLKYMLEEFSAFTDGIAFFHIREPAEIESFVRKTGALTLCITSPRGESFDNHSDRNVFAYPYSFYIENSGTLEDLRTLASGFLCKICPKGRTHA